MPETELITGNVEAVTEKNGGAVKVKGDWYGYSFPDYRGSWYDPKSGDTVKLTLQTAKNGKQYVKSIEGMGSPAVFVGKDQVEISRDRLIARQSSLKTAVDLLSVRLSMDMDVSAAAGAVIQLAHDFEEWVMRAEPEMGPENEVPYE